VRVAFALFFLPWTYISGAVTQSPSESPTVEVEGIIDVSRGLGVEFYADIVFRLISTGQLKDVQRKKGLLEEVFAAAGTARQPFRRRDAIAILGDTDAHHIEMGDGLGLDACSIRCRALTYMLSFDPQRAKELLLEITPPELPHPDCSAAVVPDLSLIHI